MPVEIVRNDITNMRVDAIVNLANPWPVVGLGTDASIHKKAGPELLAARQKIGPIAMGQAAITPAFRLDAKYVIHTVGPVWDGGSYGEEALLRSCYDQSLKLVLEHDCKSIAFPLIATNNYGFPKELETVRRMAKLSAEVTHNHPEGIKGAEAVASAIFLARTGSTKAAIKAYVEENFHYDLSRTWDEIRPDYYHVESCQETVPEAITAFLEGQSFEDVIRTAVSLGGDCDTLTCIAGSMAEAFYGVTEELKAECRKRLPEDLLEVLRRFDAHCTAK